MIREKIGDSNFSTQIPRFTYEELQKRLVADQDQIEAFRSCNREKLRSKMLSDNRERISLEEYLHYISESGIEYVVNYVADKENGEVFITDAWSTLRILQT